jgi:hypothetical protein
MDPGGGGAARPPAAPPAADGHTARVRRVRFVEEQERVGDADQRVGREQPEDPVPRRRHQQPAAAERREDRRRAHHQHHEREHLRRLDGVEAVPDHRAHDHHDRGAAERLREAQQHEGVDVLRERATHRRGREDREPDEERRLAAEAVAERPHRELADRHAEEIRRDGLLDARRRGRELRLEHRQRRQVHVERERAERHDRAQDEREPPYSAELVRYPFTHRTCLSVCTTSTRSDWFAITSSMFL